MFIHCNSIFFSFNSKYIQISLDNACLLCGLFCKVLFEVYIFGDKKIPGNLQITLALTLFPCAVVVKYTLQSMILPDFGFCGPASAVFSFTFYPHVKGIDVLLKADQEKVHIQWCASVYLSFPNVLFFEVEEGQCP